MKNIFLDNNPRKKKILFKTKDDYYEYQRKVEYLGDNLTRLPTTDGPKKHKGFFCIDGVCGLKEQSGLKMPHYISNSLFEKDIDINDHFQVKSSKGDYNIGDHIIVHNTLPNDIGPHHSMIITKIKEDDGKKNYLIVDNAGSETAIRKRWFTADELANKTKDISVHANGKNITTSEWFVYRPGSEVFKADRKLGVMSPEAIAAFNEKKNRLQGESIRNYFIHPSVIGDINKSDYNTTKTSALKYVAGLVNDDNFINNTALYGPKYTTKSDVQKALMNTLGIIEQESKFNNNKQEIKNFRNKLELGVENAFPGVMARVFGASIGPGQVKWSQLSDDVKKKAGIDRPKDLLNPYRTVDALTQIQLHNTDYIKKNKERLNKSGVFGGTITDDNASDYALYLQNQFNSANKKSLLDLVYSKYYDKHVGWYEHPWAMSKSELEKSRDYQKYVDMYKLNFDEGSYPSQVINYKNKYFDYSRVENNPLIDEQQRQDYDNLNRSIGLQFKNGGLINQANGGYSERKKSVYRTGGLFKDPPPSPIPSGVNVFATSNSIYKTPNNTTVNKPVEYNPVYKNLAEKNFTQQELAAINNKKPDVLKQDKSIPKPTQLTPFEQKVLEKEIETQTLGQQRVTYNQFGEPVLKFDPSMPKATGRIEPDYMDPITMAAAITAGGVGLGAYGLSQVPRMFLSNLASEATAGLSDVGKGMLQRFRPASLNIPNTFSNLSATNNLNLEELRRVYHNSERFLQPEEARFLHKHGHGLRENYRTSDSVWNNQQNLSDREINILSDIVQNNNQLPPPPSEIQFMPDGTTRTVYNRFVPPNQNIIPTPEGGLFGMTREQTEAAWRNIQNNPNWQQTWGTSNWSPNTFTSFKRKPVNKSGLTKEEAIQRASEKDKDVLSKMSEQEFEGTVVKPTGEVVPYYQGSLETQFSGPQNVVAISPKQYADEFNSRLDLLNDIIAQKNKSGVEYRVKGLDERGELTFYTPKQTLPDGTVIPEGEAIWRTTLKPGQWKGNVEDIASTAYFKSIPGIEMYDTTDGVFPARSRLRGTPGTKAYESINEYLKMLDLGRVKPGFNSQTETIKDATGKIIRTGSKDVWENFIKSDRAVGFYGNPRTVYGTMKSLLPFGGLGYLGYKGLQGAGVLQEKEKQPEYYKGGLIKRADGSYSQRGLWDNIRANKGSGKKPTKQMLEQERKIKAKQYRNGGYLYLDNSKSYADKFNTKLNDAELQGFNYHSNLFKALLNDTLDYDTKGFYQEVYNKYNGNLDAITKALTPGSPTEHIGTDRYKKPNHPTFSNQSKYAIPIIRQGGKWGHNEEENYDYFKANKRNIRNMINSDGTPLDYFKRAEDYNQDGIPDVKLIYKGKPVFADGGPFKDLNKTRISSSLFGNKYYNQDSPNFGVNASLFKYKDIGDRYNTLNYGPEVFLNADPINRRGNIGLGVNLEGFNSQGVNADLKAGLMSRYDNNKIKFNPYAYGEIGPYYKKRVGKGINRGEQTINPYVFLGTDFYKGPIENSTAGVGLNYNRTFNKKKNTPSIYGDAQFSIDREGGNFSGSPSRYTGYVSAKLGVSGLFSSKYKKPINKKTDTPTDRTYMRSNKEYNYDIKKDYYKR